MSTSKRVPLLLRLPVAVRGVSAEPLLGPIESPAGIERLDWLVRGGESGRGARECSAFWISDLLDRSRAARVPSFVKQLGSRSVDAGPQPGKGNDPATWPVNLRVREFPGVQR